MRERRLMGFGYRICRTDDPRALLIRKLAYEVFEITGRSPLLDVALELERIALEDELLERRQLQAVQVVLGRKPARISTGQRHIAHRGG